MMPHIASGLDRPAHDPGVASLNERFGRGAAPLGLRACAAIVALVPCLGGCVNVTAPDKPIVIELNINIRQEVIYRLDADAANTIEANPEIF